MADEESYVLITGATSGIGQSLAIEWSRSQRLLLHGRNVDRAQATLTRCANPESHDTWICDLADTLEVERSLADFLARWHGRVQCVIHCAGIVRVAPIRQMTLQETIATFNVNLFSAIVIIQALLRRDAVDVPSLRNVLFISSVASMRGEKGVAVYSASKGGVDSLVRSLAVELAPAVRVNAILPGLVRTPMSESTLQRADFQESVQSKYPLGVGDVQDVVNAATFLISDRARRMTGALWVVDGGRTAV